MVNFLKLSFLLFSISLVCSIPVEMVNKTVIYEKESENISQLTFFHESVEQKNHSGAFENLINHSRKLLRRSPSPPARPPPSPPKPAPVSTPKPAIKATPVATPKPAPVSAPKSVNVILANPVVVVKSAPAPAPVPTPAPAKTFPIYLTCDNEFDLYVNGVKVGSGNSWTTTYHFTPSIKPGDVIAIDGIDRGGPAAFIGFFDGKVTKSCDWKCSLKDESGWTKNDFNDAKWSQATSYGKNQDNNIWRQVGGGSRPNIPGDAEWLWTNDNNNHDRVFCRYTPIPVQTPPTPVVAPKSVATTTTAPTFKISSVLNDWLKTPDGQSADIFCKSLGIQNNADVYSGCLEDMRVTKSEAIAKESALTAMEFASKDKVKSPSKRYCVASGDPHCTNYDGDFFHIQEPGIYTIATSRDSVFEIQEKIRKNGPNKVGVPSCIIGALVHYKQITIEADVSNFKKLRVNGKEIDLKNDETVKYGGVTIRYGKQNVEWRGEKASSVGLKMNTPEGFGLLITGGYCGVLETSVPTEYYGKMGGICGNGDGVKNNADYFSPNGEIMNVNRGARNWEMTGYNGPTSPLSKWQLAWKPTGSRCYFAKDCEPSPPTPQQVATKTAPVAAPVVAPKTAPVAAPVVTPVATPVASPVAAPKTAPVATPVAAPKTAPVATTVAAPKTAPFAAPVVVPVAAPKTAPVAAPVVSPSSASHGSSLGSSHKSSRHSSHKSSRHSSSSSSKSVSKISPQKSIKKDEEKLKQLFKDSKDIHKFTSEKLTKLKNNILKMIGDERASKEKELSEYQKTILFSEKDLAKLNKKYDDKVTEYIALNKSITKLEEKMQQHYKQMLSDAKYLLLLDKIKPNFLKTLAELNEQTKNIKDTIQVNIVEGDDKALMLRIIYKMNDKTANYTSVLSNEFIKHYEKYKRLSGFDKAEYDDEYKQLQILKTKYEAERKLRDDYLTEYENALKILKKIQSNYNLDSEDLQSFQQIGIFIEKIFHNSKC